MNSADALRPSNTRLTWKSCRSTQVFLKDVTPFSTLVFSLLLAFPLWASTNIESKPCSQSLAMPVAADHKGLNQTLNVLVWNIEKAANPGWDADLNSLGGSSDLLLIQEASIQAGIVNALPQPLYQAFAAGYTTEKQATGVLTLSSVEPSLQCNFTAWEPWLGTPKATNITEYPIAGLEQRLLVINLHAVNFSMGMEEFNAQVRTLEPFLSQHLGPLIVAGDFNTWSSKRATSLHSFMLSHQLSPVSFSPDQRTRFWDIPLDHVYLRGLNLINASTMKVESSDHNPLMITVEVPHCNDCTAQAPQ
ncbi:MAG: endonuclease/exonuclease/phosphatase (EEP) superfamily protein YafD [Halioglobus sp.]